MKNRDRFETCRAYFVFTDFPVPAATHRATSNAEDTDDENDVTNQTHPLPGTLPPTATLSKAARGLLTRLLERDPRVRMRSLRQLQQSAFFMGYNFEHVKTMKVSPRSILHRYFPEGPLNSCESRQNEPGSEHFDNF